jgi:predicted nucleotidyltransferase
MSITGVIVEYNPLHNGHIHHLKKARQITDCSNIVAVMSGNFVQRGEPAFINKWTRTRIALESGVDLVIELPVIYANSSAEGFAFGAVSILNNIGIVDNVCFGSELGNLDVLSVIADILLEEPQEYKSFLQTHLKSGISYPRARQNALSDYIIVKNLSIKDIGDVIFNSNNILSIEYLKSLKRLSSKIKPFTIQRVNNKYNDKNITGSISSATAIRKNFNNFSVIQSLPSYSYDAVIKDCKEGKGPVTLSDFSDLIIYKLRDMDVGNIRNLIDVSEGLENRIKKAAENSRTVEELIHSIKNKRYTATRIQRILINSLLNITKDLHAKIQTPPEYIRVLGFNKHGKELIKQMSKTCPFPIITNPSNKDIDLLKYDISATDVYVLGYKNSIYKFGRQDLKIPPVVI